MRDAVHKIESQYIRAVMSREDLSEAREYLESVPVQGSTAICHGLIVAAIVTYSRPFLNSSGGGKATSMISLKLRNSLGPDEMEFHELILDIRNQAVAHSDYDKKPVVMWKDKGDGFTVSFTPVMLLLNGFELDRFKVLVCKVLLLCNEKICELNKKLVRPSS